MGWRCRAGFSSIDHRDSRMPTFDDSVRSTHILPVLRWASSPRPPTMIVQAQSASAPTSSSFAGSLRIPGVSIFPIHTNSERHLRSPPPLLAAGAGASFCPSFKSRRVLVRSQVVQSEADAPSALGGGAAKKGRPAEGGPRRVHQGVRLAGCNRGSGQRRSCKPSVLSAMPSLVATHSRFASFGPGVELAPMSRRSAKVH